MVRLDRNNRILVAQGLKRMRAGRMQAGHRRAVRASPAAIRARASAFDLGFALGPRLNAAGRLADMALGIECLLTDDTAARSNIARELDRLNRERRDIESGMQARRRCDPRRPSTWPTQASLVVHDPRGTRA